MNSIGLPAQGTIAVPEIPNSVGRPVDFARGGRDYVNSVDLMHAAPVSLDDAGFRFRFFSIVESPGIWVRAGAIADKENAKAEVRLDRENGPESFYFVCPDDGAALAKVDDFKFEFDSSGYVIEDQILTGPLQGEFEFWPQLIEAIRYAGSVVYPGMVWFVVSISGNAECLGPVIDGAELRLDIRRALGQRNMVPFSTSTGAKGRIITLQNPDD